MPGAVRVWDGTAWQYLQTDSGMTVCTSTTRPSAPFNGQIIYETDTRQYSGWDTGPTTPTWQAVLFTSMGRPFLNRGRNSDQSTITSTATDVVMGSSLDGLTGLRRFTTPDNITFTPPFAGLYQVSASVGWASAPTGRAQVSIYLNGSQYITKAGALSDLPASQAIQQVSACMNLAATDGIKVVAYQNSGGTVALTGGTQTNSNIQLTAVYIGPGPNS